MPLINYWAVLIAAASAFILGGVWYSPILFGRRWLLEVQLSDAQLAQSNKAIIFGTAFVLTFAASWMFAMFLGPKPAFGLAIGAGFAAGLFWVATSFGINYLFARRSLMLFLIDGGYHTVQFSLIGFTIGAFG
jgi:Protein of unknown function (DUF1761)